MAEASEVARLQQEATAGGQQAGERFLALRASIWILTAVAVLCGLVYAVQNFWACDDAFISFRYAQNLVRGHGLVFNPGLPPVEGYTNFLWTVLVALGMSMGIEATTFGNIVGLLFHLATIALLLWVAVRSSSGVVFPVAAIGLALHHHAAIFAICGLETAMFAFLVTAGLVWMVEARRARDYGFVGMCLILATMTRPDGALFYVLCGAIALLIAIRGRNVSMLVAYGLPFVVLYVPYFVWKYAYYGDIFPNTFYAKSAYRSYVGQGLLYVGLYLELYWFLVPALVIPAVLLSSQRGNILTAGWQGPRAALLCLLFPLVYLSYVIWVGGDFMFTRFCLPVTPALLLSFQLLVSRLRAGAAAALMGFVVVGCIAAYLHKGMVAPYKESHFIADEQENYPAWRVDIAKTVGRSLREHLRGTDAVVAIGGMEAMLAFYAEFPTVIERFGLTDRHIARREILARGKIGHEKGIRILDPYVFERRVCFEFHSLLDYLSIPGDRIGAHRNIDFHVEDPEGRRGSGWVKATMLTYQVPVMEKLRGRPGVRFQRFEEHLDTYIGELSKKDRKQVELDYRAFQRFYFDYTDDIERKRAFEQFLSRDG